MWYVRPAKAKTSLRIRAVCSEPMLGVFFILLFPAVVYLSFLGFPTMWYVRPAKAQTNLRIRAV